MKGPKALRHPPLEWLIPAGIALLVSQPLFSGRLPAGHDALLHLYRLTQLEDLVAQGILFSRWAPALGFGYGAPLFNYYAPLLYYLALLFRLVGVDPSGALGLTMILAALAGAVGLFAWLRDGLGWRGAAVASIAYLSAPYLSFTLFHRGAFAESLALSIAPLAFFFLHRWANNGQWGSGVAYVVCHALLVLSHNISALLLTALLALYPLLITRRLAVLLKGWGLLGLALGLTSFFWLPALGERDLVKIERVFVLEIFDYRRNFIAPAELFAPPTTVESGLALQPVTRSISLVALGLAVVGVVGILRLSAQRGLVIGALATGMLSIALALEISRPIWDTLSILQFVQTPWRLLGIASLAVAVLAGAGFACLERGLSSTAMKRVLLVLGLSTLAFYSFAWQFPTFISDITHPQASDIPNFERRRGLVTLSAGEYLPATIDELPPENARGRLDIASLPSYVDVRDLVCHPLRCEVRLTTAQPATLTFNIFNFPGWEALLNGQPVVIVTRPPHGLISVSVPPGEHTLHLAFASTPLRDLGSLISITCAVILAITLARKASKPRNFQDNQVAALRIDEVLITLTTLGALLLVKFALERIDTPLRYSRFDGQRLEHVDLVTDVNFADLLMLMGIDAPLYAESADQWRAVLYWRAIRPTDQNYHVAVQVFDQTGDLVGQSNTEYPGGMPSSWWPSGTYARDVHQVVIRPGTPPGQYRIQVVVYEAGKPYQRLPVVSAALDSNWRVGDTAITVGQLTVDRPRHPVSESAVRPEQVVHAPSVGGLRLIGHDRLPEQLLPGDAFRYTLYWRADSSPSIALPVLVRLRQGAGIALEQPIEPVPGYTRDRWRVGDLWRANHTLRLPATVSDGEWQLEVGVGATTVPLAQRIRVLPLSRSFTPPTAAVSEVITFAGLARLVGYDAPSKLVAGQPFSVTLYWQALEGSTARYKAFIHLLDERGERRVGNDSTPAGGHRPTTSWIPGEYITDIHELLPPADLPPGIYRLLVGLYEEWSMVRLTTTEGKDAAELSQPIRVE